MTKNPVTLQISLAPPDFRHARTLLHHQVRVWRDQVSEIVLCVDFHRSVGRFSSRWDEGKERIMELAQSIDGARVVIVDYGAEAMETVSSEFFGGRHVPTKDFRGGPYYSYFFGMTQAKQPYVLHSDSDIFFGGASPTWIEEALAELESHPDVLFVAPLPGPPAPDSRLHSQVAQSESGRKYSFRFDSMSTRIFLIDRRRFHNSIGALRPRRPQSFRDTVKAVVEGNPPEELPEHLFTGAMRTFGLTRVEFLGKAPGMWTLHPPYRCADFYEKLPELVRCVETGEIPAAQQGDHDMNGSMVDWSEALNEMAQNRWWKRLRRRR